MVIFIAFINSLKETKQTALRAVKARVDSHWKKPVATTETVSKAPTAGRSNATAAGTVGVTLRSTTANQGNGVNQVTKIAKPIITRAVAEQKSKATTDLKETKPKGKNIIYLPVVCN